MNRHKAGFGGMACLAVLSFVLAPWAIRADEPGKPSYPKPGSKEKPEPGKKGSKFKNPQAESKTEKGKASEEEIEEARAEVRERMKQFQEDGEKLRKAMEHLAQVEGRQAFPAVRATPPMPWGWPGWGMPPFPQGPGPGRDRTAELEKKTAQLEKKVDALAKELQELKKEREK
ncbi:MAG: hypothetical protein JO112_22190 [Planctomycetes bacterium]|nr:hypothetical protein [Planctomycetota bacterium]